MQSFISIPFKSESSSGFTSVNGVAKFSAAGIVFEFESKFIGLISAGVKEIGLRTEEIHDIKFKKGIFKRGAKIDIRTKSLIKLKELPNSEGKFTLKIETSDFERARDAVEQMQRDMTRQTEKVAELPPTHTPVSVLFDESEDETRNLEQQ